MTNEDLIYTRLKSGKLFDNNLQAYTFEDLISALNYFLSKEEYEKCQFIDNRTHNV